MPRTTLTLDAYLASIRRTTLREIEYPRFVRWLLSIVLLVGGCRQLLGLEPPTSDDAIDAPATPHDARADGALSDAVNDPDGDGIPSATDNCPGKPNADQGDEDNDNLGDVCDPCPISATNADNDNDGVGDACDPHPTTGGDAIALFEGFHHGIPNAWTIDSGSWTAGLNDNIVGATTSGNMGDIYLPAYSTNETVTTGVAIATTLGTGFRVAGIKDNAAAGGFAVVCSAMITSSGDTPASTKMNNLFQQPAGTFYQRTAFDWLDTPMTIKSMRIGTSYNCTTSQSTTSITTNGTESTTTTNALIGLHIQSVTARFQWLMVVTSP